MLERQVLRQKVYDLLLNKTGAGSRVHKSKLTPWEDEALPAINIFTPSENQTGQKVTSCPKFDTSLKLGIEIITVNEDGWDDVADQLAEQVLSILLCQSDIPVKRNIPSISTNIEFRSGGDAPLVATLIQIEIGYDEIYTNDPLAEIVPLEAHIAVKFKRDPGGNPDKGHIDAEFIVKSSPLTERNNNALSSQTQS